MRTQARDVKCEWIGKQLKIQVTVKGILDMISKV